MFFLKKIKFNHNFHLVNYSPWPLISSISVMSWFLSIINLMHQKNSNYFFINSINMLIIMYLWWKDIVRESTFQGLHSLNVLNSMKLGMILFIISEIFFFISFFWMFFHSSLSNSLELGLMWPPKNINIFNPFLIPLLNTIILLTSGISITWAHHSMLNNNYKQFNYSMMITIFLGIYFSILQMYEYKEASFNISDSIYGSSFFLTTGFHGFHVLMGTTFLMVSFIRHLNMNFSKNHHFGLEAAAWYWHFVDIVWLFLFSLVYWWGY